MSVLAIYSPEPGDLPHAKMHHDVFPELHLGPDAVAITRSTGMTDPEFATYLRWLAEQATWLADRLEGHHAENDGPRYVTPARATSVT